MGTGTWFWFGFGYLAASVAVAGRRVVVLGEMEATDDLVRDVTGVLTSLCARLSGRGPGPRRAARVVAVAVGRAGDVEAGWVVG